MALSSLFVNYQINKIFRTLCLTVYHNRLKVFRMGIGSASFTMYKVIGFFCQTLTLVNQAFLTIDFSNTIKLKQTVYL